LIETRRSDSKFGLAVLGAEYEETPAFGRLIQNIDGTLKKIVEHRDATDEEREINLCNTGAFCVRGDKLAAWVNKIGTNNAQKEYYITDLPVIAMADGFKTAVSVAHNETEVQGVNSREDLAALEMMIQDELRHMAFEGGATLQNPDSVYFAFDTEIGKDVTIEPNVYFGAGVTVGDNVTIHAFSYIEGATIANNVSIGPFARIRVGSTLDENVTVGNFIEVNRTHMKAGAKAKHLCYLGDAVIGEKSNIGAGTVIANYDGFDKNETTLGKGVFVGSNSTLIAPLKIGDGAIIAGGSVITDNIPADGLGLAREKQITREGWAAEFRKRKAKK
jgi:bifunctional UDP-N-acetylglucosamine pyrophosphorylase / glucosamine-1-phosphate N-acetyltransferase